MSKKLEFDEQGRIKHWQFAIRLYDGLHFWAIGKYWLQIKLPKGSFLIGFFNQFIDIPLFMKLKGW